ncbi:hypothetical protein KAW18_02415 [candidate division WOR-3 bacterium]|nr:hypothetical protein [candidate division WOR-3 bacterium]
MTQPNGRDQTKSDILSLLITKHDTSCSVANLRAEIDKKAKRIGLKPNERTELILEMRRIIEVREMVKEEEMSE